MPAWLKDYIEKWQSQSSATRYTIIGIITIALVLVFIPWRASGDEGNPLGIQVSSQPISGESQYSAEQVTVVDSASGVALEGSSSESSEESIPDSAGQTKDEASNQDLNALATEYEEFSAQLAASRSNDPNYTAPNVSSSSDSTSDSSSSSSSEESSSSETEQTDSTVESSETTETEESTDTSAGTYTVQSGDNAYRIAMNNGLTLDEFLQMNGKTEASVTPGEVVRVQ